MKVAPIINLNYKIHSKKIDNPSNGNKSSCLRESKSSYMPSFGYCNVHIHVMNTLNEKFHSRINDIFSKYETAQRQADSYNEKISASKNIYKTTGQLIAQYANYQYSTAEVIPSYAIQCASELREDFSKFSMFNDPVNLLITLSNIPKIATKPGIDQYTNKPYTKEQMAKSKANTQLYSSVILIELIDEHLSDSKYSGNVKQKIKELKSAALKSIGEIYGNDAFDRIQTLKKMGKDASIEDKRKSLALVEEFDRKAKPLNFGEEFNVKLEELIETVNKEQGRKNAPVVDMPAKIPVIIMKYHTHPQNSLHNGLTHEEMHRLNIEHEHFHEHLNNEIENY